MLVSLASRSAALLLALAPVMALALVMALPLRVSAADVPQPSRPEHISVQVSLADLDLAAPEGMRAARERLAKQALRLCRAFSDERRVADRQTVADCVSEALANALAQLPERGSQ